MSTFRLSLRVKLAAGFGLVLLLLLVSTVLVTREMGRMDAATRHISNESAPAQVVAADVRFGMADMYGFQTAYVLTDPVKQRAYFRQSLAGLQRSIRRLAPLLATAQERATYARLQASLGQFLSVDRQTWAAVQAGDLRRAQHLTLDGEAQHYTTALDAATALRVSAARRQAANAADSAATGRTARRIAWLLALVSVLAGLAIAVVITRRIARDVAVIVHRLAQLRDDCVAGLQRGLSALAAGDLTDEVEPHAKLIARPGGDELGDVARSVNAIAESTMASVDRYNEARRALGGLIGDVGTSASALSAASQAMASTSDEAGRAVGEIAGAVGEVAAGAQSQVTAIDSARNLSLQVEEITARSAQDAAGAAAAAEEARRLTTEGAGAAQEATAAMETVRDVSGEATEAIRVLGRKSEEIGGIVAAITGIAEQTNLLALNAAIEAARAGEQGRGFAVVAEEVRKLAEESQASAGSISALVGEMQAETRTAVAAVEDGARRTQDGVQTVERTRAAFGRIAGSIDDVSSRAAQIAGAAQEIADSAHRLTATMASVASVAEEASASTEEISASTQQTSASTQEIAASAAELARTASELDALAGRFRITA